MGKVERKKISTDARVARICGIAVRHKHMCMRVHMYTHTHIYSWRGNASWQAKDRAAPYIPHGPKVKSKKLPSNHIPMTLGSMEIGPSMILALEEHCRWLDNRTK